MMFGGRSDRPGLEGSTKVSFDFKVSRDLRGTEAKDADAE